MITGRSTGPDGQEIILLGITRGNVEELMKGRPIHVSAATHPGFPLNLSFMIVFGETERTLMDALKPVIGADTKLIAPPKAPGRVS